MPVKATNASLADYKIPGIRDIPAVIVNEFVDARQATGPYGAKGVGESGSFGVSPPLPMQYTMRSAFRVTRLPVTPEAVYEALRGAA